MVASAAQLKVEEPRSSLTEAVVVMVGVAAEAAIMEEVGIVVAAAAEEEEEEGLATKITKTPFVFSFPSRKAVNLQTNPTDALSSIRRPQANPISHLAAEARARPAARWANNSPISQACSSRSRLNK